MSELRELLTSHEVAQRLRISASCLRNWRREGRGPRWVQMGARSVVYDSSDVARWLEDRKRGTGVEVAADG